MTERDTFQGQDLARESVEHFASLEASSDKYPVSYTLIGLFGSELGSDSDVNRGGIGRCRCPDVRYAVCIYRASALVGGEASLRRR